MEKATFGGGCFWGIEAAFRKLEGVTNAEVGYSGGNLPNPTYEEVCTDRTGHAEVVRVEFDPKKISYEDLLGAFFQMHDPTTKNRQGPDIGSQYRSVIFFHTAEQEQKARAFVDDLQQKSFHPIVTEIKPAEPFYRAEEYHQRYLEKHGGHCQF